MEVTTGKLLGGYQIIGTQETRRISDVYLARGTSAGRSVAVKVLPEMLLNWIEDLKARVNPS